MSDTSKKMIYWVTTGLLTAIVLMYVGNSILNSEIFTRRFGALGYPTYLIYPLTIAKLLGLIAIWSNVSKTLKEWAYAGFFFDFILAIFAEAHASDGEYVSSPFALVALLISYNIWKKAIGNQFTKTEPSI